MGDETVFLFGKRFGDYIEAAKLPLAVVVGFNLLALASAFFFRDFDFFMSVGVLWTMPDLVSSVLALASIGVGPFLFPIKPDYVLLFCFFSFVVNFGPWVYCGWSAAKKRGFSPKQAALAGVLGGFLAGIAYVLLITIAVSYLFGAESLVEAFISWLVLRPFVIAVLSAGVFAAVGALIAPKTKQEQPTFSRARRFPAARARFRGRRR